MHISIPDRDHIRSPVRNLRGTPVRTATGAASTARLALTDQHTDVVATFSAADTTLTQTATYDPLGNTIGTRTVLGNLGYQSEYTDTSSGKVNMAARWYNPATGQFTSRDTVQNNPVPNSAAANPFAYGNDDPFAGTDPTGHMYNSSLDITPGKRTTPTNKATTHPRHQPVRHMNRPEDRLMDPHHPNNPHPDPDGYVAYHNTSKRQLANLRAANKAIEKSQRSQRPGHQMGRPDDRLDAGDPDGYVAYHNTTKAQIQQLRDADREVEQAEYRQRGCQGDNSCEARQRQTADVERAIVIAEINDPKSQLGMACKIREDLCEGYLDQLQRGGNAEHIAVDMMCGESIACYDDYGHPLAMEAHLGDALSSKATFLIDMVLIPGSAPEEIGAEALARAGESTAAEAAARGAGEATGGGSPGFRRIVGEFCSFSPDTPVLLADRTTKPIAEVRIGDRVLATDPETGATRAKDVTALHKHTDTELVDLSIKTKSGGSAIVHTTAHHPFWSQKRKKWVEAASLTVHEKLAAPIPLASPAVDAVHSFTGSEVMYNLTIADIHTYYVLAGNTPVLVHNEGGWVVPDDYVIVRGGQSPMPGAGEVFSGSMGTSVSEAGGGVPHGSIRVTTAGAIRAAGGTVTYAPEPTAGGAMNYNHVNVSLGETNPFGELEANPVPKAGRLAPDALGAPRC